MTGLVRHGFACASLVAALVISARPARPQTATGRLDFSDKIRMVNCDPASNVPCFRVKLNIVDPQGNPLAAQLPAPEKLADNLTFKVDDQEITPFYAVAHSGDTKAMRGRLALVVVDISGSMNRVLPSGQTRFDAARAAISHFLEGFENGADRVAVVPFESHNVAAAIHAAHFAATKEEALRQVQAIPAPKPRNNTALYSAVAMGLDVLADQTKDAAGSTSPPETLLIVMTDGTNEILRGDDLGLLAGPAGLEQAATKVQNSGVQVIGVGFGEAKEIDETALRRLSTKYYMAADLEGLKRIFTFARTLLTNRIQAAFASPWPDRASLAGKTLHITALLKLPNGDKLASGEKTWATPQMGVPLFEGKCDSDEAKALLQKNAPGGTGWMPVLRPVLVFVGLGTLLLILWFWVPRLMWPEQYIGVFPGAGARWSGQTKFGASKISRQGPPGFDSGKAKGRAPQRTPADATVVQPRPDFGKTRLDKGRE